MRFAVFAIALGAFAVGTTEFVVIGLLPTIGADLGVDIATAGLLVTGYAVGIAVGGPILTFVTRRMPKPTVLVTLMAGFAIAHLLLAVAPTFELLLLGRLVTASAHGAFFAVGAIVAAETAGRGHEGRAIGLMFTGLTVATVIGVPLGTFIGQQTSWRVPFLVVAGLAAVAAIAIRLVVRIQVRSAAVGPPVTVDRSALALALATTVIGFGSQFVVFTFLAAFLEQETRIDPGAISLFLVVFGVASAVGSILGGRASDRWPRATLPVALAILAFVLAAFGLAGNVAIAVIPLLFAWGVAGFVLSPALQARVVGAAGPGNTLASSLNISAFNVGIASGSLVGTAVVADGGLALTPFVAAGLASLAIAPALIGSRRSMTPALEPEVPAAGAAVRVPSD
jgi:MFS transporter, DHA1 family, inner membrane transport protein